jgi:hypothetical protein
LDQPYFVFLQKILIEKIFFAKIRISLADMPANSDRSYIFSQNLQPIVSGILFCPNPLFHQAISLFALRTCRIIFVSIHQSQDLKLKVMKKAIDQNRMVALVFGAKFIFLLFVFLPLLISNSFAQFSLNFESARSLKKNAVEFGGQYGVISESYEGKWDKMCNSFGLKLGLGLSDRVDLKFNYSRMFMKELDIGFNTFSITPKISTNSQKFAFALPFGSYFSEVLGPLWFVAPKVILTLPYKKFFEASLAGLGHIIFKKADFDSQFFAGLNFGVAISSDLDKWSFRPEMGFLKSLVSEDEGTLWTTGIAVTYNIFPKK